MADFALVPKRLMMKFISSTAPYVIAIRIVANAHAGPNEPFSASSLMRTVMSRYCGVTSRMMAEMAVMERTNAVTRPARNESLMSGRVTVRNTVTPHGTFPWTLPRLGLSFKLDKALEGIRYYGRGPRENYIDRKTGSFMGLYDSTVTEQFEDYVRPQDNGYKCDVRWAAFTAADGKGVKFSASEPLFLQALHYSAEDLEFARHRNKQQRFRTPLPKREEVMLNLDIRQLGLGGGSCGPAPMDKYIFPVQKETWTLVVKPVRGRKKFLGLF